MILWREILKRSPTSCFEHLVSSKMIIYHNNTVDESENMDKHNMAILNNLNKTAAGTLNLKPFKHLRKTLQRIRNH